MNEYLLNCGLGFLLLFALLAPFDGIYLHLIKYKLQEHPQSKFEHLTHTARAILFIPTVLLLFYWNVSGPILWLLSAFILLDWIIGLVDVLAERRSRAPLGGLSSGEYLLHVVLTSFHVAALTLALASKPKEAWLFSMDLPQHSETVRLISLNLVPGGIFISLLHVALLFKPNLITFASAQIQDWKWHQSGCCFFRA